MSFQKLRHISFNLYLRRNVSNTRVLASGIPENYSPVSRKKDKQEDEQQNKTSAGKYIFPFAGGILAAICGYELEKKFFPTVEAKTFKSRRGQFNFIADVVQECASTVVYIEIKDKRRVDYYTGQPITASNGSGFIIKENGLILTNAHVVINKPNTSVQVRLQDGRTFPGVVEDVDQSSDLATVRIKCDKLPVMKLGESKSLRTGEWVVAMGSPLSLSNTVTSGVVSNTQRASHELGLQGLNINYIQTDAAITFGNSGGPLVNLDGEAIGVNSMKVTSGISFAIPIDYVKEFLLRNAGQNKKVGTQQVRQYIGITMLTLTTDLLHELKNRSRTVPTEVQSGVLVWKVILNSPAHAGGLHPGDIVTHINGKEVKNSNDVYQVLDGKQKSLEMSVYRGFEKLKITVIPEEP